MKQTRKMRKEETNERKIKYRQMGRLGTCGANRDRF